MGNRIGETPGGGLSSTRKSVSAIRYLPAALATLLLIAILVAFGSHLGEASWYGLFTRGKGAPPASTSTVLVTADPGAGAMDASTLSLLTAAILERGPAVVALGPAGAYDSAALETLDTEPLPAGPLVLSHVFARFRPWTFPENGAPAYPPVLSRSLYPALDGPEPGLKLPMGEGLEISDTVITRGALESGSAGPTTGFSAPLAGDGPAWTLPAFARLERGVTASLGVEAARRALGVPSAKVGYVEGVGALFSANHVLPISASGEALPRFHATDGIPRIPASRFLEGRVSSTEVRGKLVFVDPAAGAPVATAAGPRSVTEAQASLAAGLMEGHLLNAPAWGGTLSVLAGLLFASVIVIAGLALDFGIAASAALALLLAAFYPAVAYFAFLKSSWWLPPQLPPLMAAAAWIPLALTRLLAPAAPPRSPSIQPASGYDPALVPLANLGRPAGQPLTPPRGTPHVAPAPAAMPAHAEPIAPAYPQAQPARPRPLPPRERQGAPVADAEPRLAGQRFVDPRDPPIVPSAVDLRPAAAAPAPRPAPAPAPAAPPPPPGEDIERDAKGGLVRVGKYRIVRKMGFGSAGDVFEGFDTRMGRKVAIKTITKNAAANFDRAADRFVLEAKAAGSLNHPCINTIYDFGTIRDVSYMVLEYLDGITLSQWMRSNPQPPHPRAVAHWLQQIASALDYAHAAKIIHRDLKPSNLMVINNGTTMKLLDFGIAKMDDVGLTQTGMTVGTPSYMSPEQLSGIKVGPASDQYGFAVVAYQLLTYKLPYVGTKIPELCNRILKNEIVPIGEVNPSLGGPFWEALRKGLSKAPEERYPNCLSLCASLVETMPN